jgi:hypothetical protein
MGEKIEIVTDKGDRGEVQKVRGKKRKDEVLGGKGLKIGERRKELGGRA